MKTDVLVIGAGAAGLAVAGKLREAGLQVTICEARDRIGGRILTIPESVEDAAIELGAEFIHGDAGETDHLLRLANRSSVDVRGENWEISGRRFQQIDYWKSIDRVLSRINTEKPDESFADFLARRPGGRSVARDRTAALQFVQGFHAADPREIGVHSIAPDGEEPPSGTARNVARPLGGYGAIVEVLAGPLAGLIHLETRVTAIDWSPGVVEATVQSGNGQHRIQSQAAVVTLPCGVLQAPPGEPGTIRFTPDPATIRKALNLVSSGPVVRLVVRFREFPWRRAARGRDVSRLSFLHARQGPFSVWWTAYPLKTPLAVAWSGGPPARALSGRTHEEVEATALSSLARELKLPRSSVASLVERTWLHDWTADPFSRGAYSYSRVGGAEAARVLSTPIKGTLFFAGEAADAEGRTGTVEGAIGSGFAAARKVVKALRR